MRKGRAPRVRAAAASLLPASYATLLTELKARVRSTQAKAATAVNRELIALYLYIGKRLAEQSEEGWGDRVVERLATDLRRAFPSMKGFSRTNVFYMRQVHLVWRDAPKKVQQLVGQLPWGHHLVLITQMEDATARAWYAEQAVTHGWSRSMLTAHVESRLHARQGNALTNFKRTLAPPQSDLARETLKDPYVFDFLTLGPEAQERDLERGLLAHVRDFLLELGVGFALVGSQVHLEVGGEDFYVDLLFYHLKLRCFVVIDLKTVAFRPEHAGKMNFYLSAVDAQLRQSSDNASIGLILCKSKNKLVAEYALRDTAKPIGVSAYRLFERLPARLAGSLPSVQELEAELGAKKR